MLFLVVGAGDVGGRLVLAAVFVVGGGFVFSFFFGRAGRAVGLIGTWSYGQPNASVSLISLSHTHSALALGRPARGQRGL